MLSHSLSSNDLTAQIQKLVVYSLSSIAYVVWHWIGALALDETRAQAEISLTNPKSLSQVYNSVASLDPLGPAHLGKECVRIAVISGHTDECAPPGLVG